MAAEAEAERDRRARRDKTHKGELEAAVKLRQASEIIGEKGYRMRTLQTLDSVVNGNSDYCDISNRVDRRNDIR